MTASSGMLLPTCACHQSVRDAVTWSAPRWLPVLLVVLVCGTAAAPQGNACAATDIQTKRVLLIGIDGVRSDALKIADVPQLAALIKGGAFADDTQILGQRFRGNETVSGPGWASILTGVWADKHGVHDNDFEGNNFERYPDFLRRLKQVRPAATTAAFTSYKLAHSIVTSADVLGMFPMFPPRRRAVVGYLNADRQMAEAAGRHLTEANPVAVFVSFMLPDAVGHRSGFHPNVREYRHAIETIDGLIGSVLRALRNRKTFARENWLVLVTSDHGGQGLHHRGGHEDPEVLTVFLIVNGPAVRRGKIESRTYIVDPAVTALTHLNVDIDPAWGLDGNAVGLTKP
jgi:predicted AlkP superfamily pyrophosphatase or phosphodiesterase